MARGRAAIDQRGYTWGFHPATVPGTARRSRDGAFRARVPAGRADTESRRVSPRKLAGNHFGFSRSGTLIVRQTRRHDSSHFRPQQPRCSLDIVRGRRRDQWVIRDGQPARPRQCSPRRPGLVSSHDRHRKDWNTKGAREPKGARLESLEPAIETPPALREDHDGLTGLQEPHAFTSGLRISRLDVDGKGTQATNQPGEPEDAEQYVPSHVVHRPANWNGDQDRVRVRHMVRHDDYGAGGRDVVHPFEANAEVGARAEPHGRAEHVQDRRSHVSILPR
jgi:hypothetical protein